MTDFDPYRKWLGFPPDEQPPHHYRLLGIGLFEGDPDVIANAADRQMFHVRTYQAGPYAEVSQFILNESAAARVCLLDPLRKAEYDQWLRQALPANQPLAPPVAAPAPPMPAPLPPLPSSLPSPMPALVPPSPLLSAGPAMSVPGAVPASSPLAASGMFAYPGAAPAAPAFAPAPMPVPWIGNPPPGALRSPTGPTTPPASTGNTPPPVSDASDFLAAVATPAKRESHLRHHKKKKNETTSVAIVLLAVSLFGGLCILLMLPGMSRMHPLDRQADDGAVSARPAPKPLVGPSPVNQVPGGKPSKVAAQPLPQKPARPPVANKGDKGGPTPPAPKPGPKVPVVAKPPAPAGDKPLNKDEDIKPGDIDPNAPNIKGDGNTPPAAPAKPADTQPAPPPGPPDPDDKQSIDDAIGPGK